MAMNRRNVLVGLGAIAIGGGAALGSGAFSTASADRTVTVSTASDTSGDALVGFTILNSDYVEENNDGAITVDVTNVNVDATVTINSAFEIVNNHTAEVTLDNQPWEVSNNNITITLTPGTTTVQSGNSTPVDVEVDTTDASSGASISDTVTIEVST